MDAQPTPVISFKPIVLAAPERGDDLQVRVSMPATGDQLPVIVFSHGYGQSMDVYAPLVDIWAAHGFVVIQPTHLDSTTLALPPADPRTPIIWRSRIADLTRVLDDLDLIEASVPGLAGRLDRGRIVVAGHSWGATTASALLGAALLVVADLGARLAGGIPVGVVTAFLGAPFFLWLLRRSRRVSASMSA